MIQRSVSTSHRHDEPMNNFNSQPQPFSLQHGKPPEILFGTSNMAQNNVSETTLVVLN